MFSDNEKLSNEETFAIMRYLMGDDSDSGDASPAVSTSEASPRITEVDDDEAAEIDAANALRKMGSNPNEDLLDRLAAKNSIDRTKPPQMIGVGSGSWKYWDPRRKKYGSFVSEDPEKHYENIDKNDLQSLFGNFRSPEYRLDPEHPPVSSIYGRWGYWVPGENKYISGAAIDPEKYYSDISPNLLKKAFGDGYLLPSEREKLGSYALAKRTELSATPSDKPPIMGAYGIMTYWDPVDGEYQPSRHNLSPEEHYALSPEALSEKFSSAYEAPVDRRHDELVAAAEAGKPPSYLTSASKWMYHSPTEGTVFSTSTPEEYYGVDTEGLQSLFGESYLGPQETISGIQAEEEKRKQDEILQNYQYLMSKRGSVVNPVNEMREYEGQPRLTVEEEDDLVAKENVRLIEDYRKRGYEGASLIPMLGKRASDPLPYSYERLEHPDIPKGPAPPIIEGAPEVSQIEPAAQEMDQGQFLSSYNALQAMQQQQQARAYDSMVPMQMQQMMSQLQQPRGFDEVPQIQYRQIPQEQNIYEDILKYFHPSRFNPYEYPEEG